jgi:hypothetical protein
MAERTRAEWDRILTDASHVALKFTGSELPNLANEGIQQLIDDAGRINAAKKYIEKAEKILKETLKGKIRGGDIAKQASGEQFKFDLTLSSRTALDQEFAKAKLRELGVPESDFMKTTEVETMRFSDV